MIRIQQLKIKLHHSEEDLIFEILKSLKIKKTELLSWKIIKRSIDARKKPDLRYVYTIDAKVRNQEKVLQRSRSALVSLAVEQKYVSPKHGSIPLDYRPVIIGTGPAGLFCGLLLAREGYCPILFERGEKVEQRQKKVESFWETGILNEQTNVQFGEGGAGTFSDGKLNTANKDRIGRNRYVLESFVKAGAPEEILWTNKPHIGTDILRNVVKNIREEIVNLGGEFFFESQLTDMKISNGSISEIEVNHERWFHCQVLVLAIGHSARDTFEMLYKQNLSMEAKPFAVGVRIEHPQVMIDEAQYGKTGRKGLLAADYKFTKKLANGRGVYSFCMCPGGYVVNASSEKNRIAVNGMSYHSRSSENANSAIVVTVNPSDFGSTHVLSGMYFQRKLEETAFQLGNGRIPMQLFSDFCQGVPSSQEGNVNPCVKGDYSFTNLKTCFSEELYESIKAGIVQCGQMIKGFDRKDALLSGVESRTSSPVRIPRNEELESCVKGIYPCGEGAGYAGGITSAAMDGLRVAEQIIRKYLSF